MAKLTSDSLKKVVSLCKARRGSTPSTDDCDNASSQPSREADESFSNLVEYAVIGRRSEHQLCLHYLKRLISDLERWSAKFNHLSRFRKTKNGESLAIWTLINEARYFRDELEQVNQALGVVRLDLKEYAMLEVALKVARLRIDSLPCVSELEGYIESLSQKLRFWRHPLRTLHKGRLIRLAIEALREAREFSYHYRISVVSTHRAKRVSVETYTVAATEIKSPNYRVRVLPGQTPTPEREGNSDGNGSRPRGRTVWRKSLGREPHFTAARPLKANLAARASSSAITASHTRSVSFDAEDSFGFGRMTWPMILGAAARAGYCC